jgi:hypothetical protein
MVAFGDASCTTPVSVQAQQHKQAVAAWPEQCRMDLAGRGKLVNSRSALMHC